MVVACCPHRRPDSHPPPPSPTIYGFICASVPSPVSPVCIDWTYRPQVYMNTLEKYTQWERPTQLPAPPFGSRGDVREVDVPRMSTQRSYASGDGNSGVDPSDSQRHASRQLWPRAPNRPHKTSSADQGAAVAVKAELPENWKMGETADGRQCKAGRARDVVMSCCLFVFAVLLIHFFVSSIQVGALAK